MDNANGTDRVNDRYDYFYPGSADSFTFFRIPKTLFTDPEFSLMSTDAKILYGLFLDRLGLSISNKYIDKEGRVFVLYKIEHLMEMLHFGKNKVMRLLSELKGAGLLESRKQGNNRPNIYYLKDFSSGAGNVVGRKFQNETAGSPGMKLPDVPKRNPNKNNTNNNESNNYYTKNASCQKTKGSFHFKNERVYDYEEIERHLLNRF